MYIDWEPAAQGLMALSYWSPSPGNFLSVIVVSLRRDMRIRADAVEVLRIISSSPADELLRVVEASGATRYSSLCAEAFAEVRARAITLVKMCLNASQDRPAPLRKDMRRIPDRRVNLQPRFAGPERRHIVDRRIQVKRPR